MNYYEILLSVYSMCTIWFHTYWLMYRDSFRKPELVWYKLVVVKLFTPLLVFALLSKSKTVSDKIAYTVLVLWAFFLVFPLFAGVYELVDVSISVNFSRDFWWVLR